MAILIANLSTNDLAVKIDDFYFPLAIEANQSTIDDTGLTPVEERVWKDRDRIISEYFNTQEGDQTPIEKLFNEYNQNSTSIKDRLLPGAIYGVISRAYNEFEVKSAYIFITQQNASAFELIKKSVGDRYRDLSLNPILIPETINPQDQDELLDFYYRFYQENFRYAQSEELVLVSVTGGTTQMQTGLKLTVITSNLQNLLFIEPILSAKNILNGYPSDCQLSSYWKYFQGRKYLTVAQLLKGWDFNGSMDILRGLLKKLKYLSQYDIKGKDEIIATQKKIDLIIKALFSASFLFDLDLTNSLKILTDNELLATAEGLRLKELLDSHNSLLNLYSKTLINRETSKLGSFLITLSAFQQGLLYKIRENYGGSDYVSLDNSLEREKIHRDFAPDLYRKITQSFNDARLSNRYLQRDFIEILLQHRENNQGVTGLMDLWLNARKLLESLDYWLDQRNNLIHGSEGVSLNRIHDLNDERPPEACAYRDITLVMAKLLNNELVQLPPHYQEEFVNTGEYYVYSNVRQWAISELSKMIGDQNLIS